ncbi:glycosyltransferase [Lactobacillaceae bacterium L1_55_11]|nr:glycosyltransferase [Lactobacillaceae bacterium L1_55_11]
MKVELINSLDYASFPGISWQIKQVKNGQSDELWLATPHEDAYQLVQELGLAPHQVYDVYARAYLSDDDNRQNGIWFADLPVPNQAQIVVNDDWTKSVTSVGQELAQVRWFVNSNRIVQAVSWLDNDGVIDYKDIYQRDGRLFAKQYFSEGTLLESDFYLGQDQPQTQDFYFEGQRNFVYANGEKYSSAEAYVADIGNHHPENEYRITQVGRELDFAPKGTTLAFPDTVLDDQGNVLGNLVAILKNDGHPVEHVQVTAKDFALLKKAGLPLKRVSVFKP